ncbi:DUF305 domain-containing protein [Amycolatopsis acidiphila]|nr:DUF305 domain-containing protein [Amycolatopsis acidiphila]GHG99119.1 hypothetical protein GCM10017788_79550 [Amycolatopsis acidiphila]
MADLVSGRTSNAKVADLAHRIQQAQDLEIQKMTGWLTAWGAAPTSTDTTMPGASGGHPMPDTSGTSSMAGMMSEADMTALRGMTGAEFDRRWLQMMIQHHQGAIDMARTELAQGSSADAKTLAQQIIEGQQAEITEMNGLLGQR